MSAALVHATKILRRPLSGLYTIHTCVYTRTWCKPHCVLCDAMNMGVPIIPHHCIADNGYIIYDVVGRPCSIQTTCDRYFESCSTAPFDLNFATTPASGGSVIFKKLFKLCVGEAPQQFI